MKNLVGYQEKVAQTLLNKFLKPHWIVFFTFLASACAWLIPDFLGFYKGFEDAEELDLLSLTFILAWYFFIITLAFVGFSLGSKLFKVRQFSQYARLDRSYIYYLYSFIAFIGFLYTVFVTFQVLGINGFIYSVLSFTTNRIAEAIYHDYSAGIFSLRYVLILSFGWALYRILILKRFRLIDFLNVFFFIFYIAFFGRRLQLVCSLIVFLALANKDFNLFRQIKLSRFYWLVFFGFILLSTATLLRNYGSYERMGFSNPLSAVITNIVSYLAAPFQASLAVGNNVLDAFRGVDYWEYTDLDHTLTANSAFADMVTSQGMMAIIKINISALVFGFIGGWLHRNKENYLYTGYPIILYAFAELWRIDLFSKGIFLTLLIVSVMVPILCSIFLFLLPKKKKIISKQTQ